MSADAPAARHGLLSPGFWPRYAVTLRPYLLAVSGAAGLVGLAIAPPLPPARLAACLLAFVASYGLGQALTDVFQTDTDALSSPYRPLVRGEIGRGEVLAVSLLGLVLCGAALALASAANLALALLAVLGLAAYTPLKRRWWGGPPCNAAVVALLPAMGLLCGEPSPARAALHPLLLPAVVSVFGSYAVFVVLGYLKDVEADRATGYETVAVRFGRRTAVLVSATFGLVAVAASVAFQARAAIDPSPGRLPGATLWAAGLVCLAAAHVRAWGVRDDAGAHPAVVLSVRAFVLLHLGEAALVRPEFLPPALAILLLFEGALVARPCREQV